LEQIHKNGDALKIHTLIITAILISSSFPGCIQKNSDTDISIPTYDDNLNKNSTATILQNYTAELDGWIQLSITGWETIATYILGTDRDRGEFNITNPTRIKLVVNYNSSYGDILVQLTDPNPNNDDLCWYSEGDGGGVETVILEKSDIEDANDRSGYWWFYIFGGVLNPSSPDPANMPDPVVNVTFHVKITIWGCPINDANMQSVLGG
jgi:hypothetical protein